MRAKYVAIGVVLGVLLSSAVVVLAGSLDPPSGPSEAASQMFTLEQIYDRLSKGATGGKMTAFTEPAAGPGSTMHTLDDIMGIAPAADDADGATAADVAIGRTFWGLTTSGWGPMTGAATGADPACYDDANRYVDCGNGTVTDTVTGLIWLKKANCYATLFASYAYANERAVGLKDGTCGLTDNSSAGDWRLPTAEEWFATTARARAKGCQNPALTNSAGTGCFAAGPQPFTGVPSGVVVYWTSSALENFPDHALYMQLGTGLTFYDPKADYHHIWAVRGGQ